jgi:hypothetical protein
LSHSDDHSPVEQMAVAVASQVHMAYDGKVVLSGAASLTLSPEAPIHVYQDLMLRLCKESTRTAVIDTMLKFWIGDLLVQGRDIYGEEYACVFGVQFRWSAETMQYIYRAAERVPPDLRIPRLPFRFYADVSGFDLEKAEMERFINLAVEYFDEGDSHWRRRALEALVNYKLDVLTRGLPEAKRTEMLDRWKLVGKPTWRKARAWINGEQPMPQVPLTLPKTILTIRNAIFSEEAKGQLSDEDWNRMRDLAADCMWQMTTAIKQRRAKMPMNGEPICSLKPEVLAIWGTVQEPEPEQEG